VQRLYPVLLSASIALCIATFVQPRLAEDLMALAGDETLVSDLPVHPSTNAPTLSFPAVTGPPAEDSLRRALGPISGELPPEAQPFERGQIVARVGMEVILYSDIAMGLDEIRAQYQNHLPAEELERQIQLLLRQRLKTHIDTKLLYLDVKAKLPREALKNVEKRVGEQFDSVEINNMIKRGKLRSREELEEKLRAMNTSLEHQKRTFTEQILAHQWLKQQLKVDQEVTYDQMVAYYREHLAEYEHPARAQWQQLTIRFSRIPDKAEAYRAIAALGNRVLSGEDFAEVAKAGSHGSTAQNGGLRDWTVQGSLVSQVLDQAIFSLPIGALSPILEDDQGFHIIRVLRRQEAHRTSFLEAQAEIRQKIRQQREKGQEEEYLSRLREKIPIWTVFDGQPDPTIATNRRDSTLR